MKASKQKPKWIPQIKKAPGQTRESPLEQPWFCYH